MTDRSIRLLAALANPAGRERFARLVLAGPEGLPAEAKADRLLLESGCAQTSGNSTTMSAAGIRAALDELRAARTDGAAERPREFLPRRSRDRVAALQALAGEVLHPDERVSEADLNERLSAHVTDAALFRRALFDHGLIDRDPATQTYWRTAGDH